MRRVLGAWLFVGMLAFPGCGIEPDRVFERNAPQVDRAIEALDAGEAGPAAELLQAYLGTGKCEKGEIGVTDLARNRANASFDLGLALFLLGEKFGARFGEEELSLRDGGPTDEQKQQMELRGEQVTCALKILRAIGSSKDLPVDLAARARYLEGNLEFLRRNYRDAVRAYDDALRLVPGVASDAGDEVGRDAAWNRAIALRRIEDNERDAGQDAQEDQDASQDTSPDTDSGSPEGGEDAPQESGDEGQQDAPSEDSGGGDGAPDGGDGSAPEDENKQPDAGAPDGGKQPPPEPQTQDERILDMLEAAPTVQLEDARRNAARRQTRGMVDK
jgi:tetratricopeptide (TPR) repeat protein